MRNTHKVMALAVTFLPLFLAIISVAHGQHPGMGTTNYATIGTVMEGEMTEFKVVRLYNTGDIALLITPTWIPESGFGVNVTFPHNPIELGVDERKVIYASVEGIKPGNFSGAIHFETEAKYPSNISGNPSYPASTVTAMFIVTGTPFNWTPVIIGCVAGVGALSVGVTVFLKKRTVTTKKRLVKPIRNKL